MNIFFSRLPIYLSLMVPYCPLLGFVVSTLTSPFRQELLTSSGSISTDAYRHDNSLNPKVWSQDVSGEQSCLKVTKVSSPKQNPKYRQARRVTSSKVRVLNKSQGALYNI